MSAAGCAWASAAALVAVAALAPPTAEASVPQLFGYGARGVALAGTLTATAAGHEAVYYNPAGLAFSRRPKLALGIVGAGFLLEVDGASVHRDVARAMVIGFDVPLPFVGPLRDRLAIGFGFVLPESAILVADIPRPGTPRFVRLDTRAETVSLMGGLGVRLTDSLGLGLGFIALSELRGAIAVAPNDARRIGTEVKDELVADYAPIAGIMLQPADGWSLGAAFRGESAADFSLPITAELGDQFPLPIPPLDVSGTAQYDPAELAVAVSHRIAPELLLSLALVYQAWSRYPNPIAFTAVPSSFPAQPDPGFSDVLAIRTGAEGTWRLGALEVEPRLGIAFEPTPVPEQRGFHNYLDNGRLVLAGGAGLRWRRLSLDFAAQWHLVPERIDVKDPALMSEVPPFIDTPGPGSRVTGPQISHSGSVLVAGLELGVEL